MCIYKQMKMLVFVVTVMYIVFLWLCVNHMYMLGANHGSVLCAGNPWIARTRTSQFLFVLIFILILLF